MTKRQMAEALAAMSYQCPKLRAGMIKHQMENRTAAEVKESYQRWLAITATTEREIRQNCQLAGLPKLGQ